MPKFQRYAKPIDLHAPGAIDDLLAFHRSVFGDTRMVDEPTGAEKAAEAAAAEKAATDKAAADAKAATERGFPENTPLAEMTVDQQAAYWKHQARKHEGRANERADYEALKAERDALKAATQTEAEKAAEAAKAEGRKEAASEIGAKFAARLVAAELKAALAGKIPADKLAGQVEFIDHSKFLTADGEVDTDKVTQYAAGLAPAGGWPDTGQGSRGGTTTGKGVSAGADMYAASRGKKTT